MKLAGCRRAFSLIEVILAVGIFAAAVVVTLAMLPALTRQSLETEDGLTTQRLPDAIRVELCRLAATGGFDTLVSTIQPMAAPMPATLSLVGSRDGSILQSENYLAPAAAALLPEAERYFLIEVWRFSSGQLAYDATGAVLPVYVRVSWPYRVPSTAATVAPSQRVQTDFTVAIMR